MKRLLVNGTEREFADDATLADVLAELETTRQGVAVALDGVVVRRGRWDGVVPDPGARLDVLTAVQGG